MRKMLIVLLMSMTIFAAACTQESSNVSIKTVPNESSNVSNETKSDDNLIFIQGGSFVSTATNFNDKDLSISDLYMGKYEVTQKEWQDVMGYNPSQFIGANLPVEMVSWYDVIEYCNTRSMQEGLEIYYNIEKNKMDPDNISQYDNVKWTVTINEEANGYRLPTEAEWEYAAAGGQMSQSFAYSGSENVDEVAWYWKNAGDKYLLGDWNWPQIESNHNSTKSVGKLEPNELGLYDMSGNVREWVWEWYEDSENSIGIGSFRVVKGGGWIGDVSNNEIAFRGKFEANGFGPDQGFRICRNA